MSKQFLTDIDLEKNQLQNAVLHPLSSAPSSPKEGQIYYNSVDKNFYRYDGTAWKTYQSVITAQGVLQGDGSGNISSVGTANTTTVGIDTTPTNNSNNLITSGGVYSAISNLDIPIVLYDTTSNWNANSSYIPPAGAIIIYSDYATENNINIPNVKIGDGLAYLIDLPYVSDDLRNQVLSHVSNTTVHITAAERTAWNNKVSCSTTILTSGDYRLNFTTSSS